MKLFIFSLVTLLSVASESMALIPKFSKKIAAEHVSNSRKFIASSTSLKTASVNDNGSTKIHQAVTRKKWGVDNDFENEYWFDQRIHTLGNSGFGGAVHAAVAAFSTKIIDFAAYDGVDIRKEVRELLRSLIFLLIKNRHSMNVRFLDVQLYRLPMSSPKLSRRAKQKS